MEKEKKSLPFIAVFPRVEANHLGKCSVALLLELEVLCLSCHLWQGELSLQYTAQEDQPGGLFKTSQYLKLTYKKMSDDSSELIDL